MPDTTFRIDIVKDNVVPYNSKIQNFLGSFLFPKGSKVALVNASYYYSWFNITSALNNNVLYYKVAGVSNTITIADGIYSIDTLNQYIHFVMKANGHYLLNSVGSEVYYISIVANPTSYSFTTTCSVIPNALPAGYSNPSGWALPAVAQNMQLVIPNTNISILLGYTPATLPAVVGATTYMKNSDFTPQIANITTVLIHCNLVNNSYFNTSNPDVIIAHNPIGIATIQSVDPKFLQYVPVHNTYFNNVSVRFTDQNGNDITMKDYKWTVSLMISIPE
jgi:hypothetical protein